MRQFAPLLLVPVAVVLVAIGYDQYSMTQDVLGGVYRPRGSLGLALMLTGLVIGYWGGLSLARPSWGSGLAARFRAAFRTPGRFIIAGLFLGGFGIGLATISATIDTSSTYLVYYPYYFLGLEVALIGAGLLAFGVWRMVARARKPTS